MNRKQILMTAGLSLAGLLPLAASAHTDLSIGLNLGGYAPVYEAPPPVYYAPPPRVYYAPPTYYGPTVVYTRPDWEEHRWHEEHERREHEWREHREHDDD